MPLTVSVRNTTGAGWWIRSGRVAGLIAVLSFGTLGCRVSFSPLQNRIAVGAEPFVIFVGDGEEGAGDLFAAAAAGGAVHPVTFTRLHETMPLLAPDGTTVAFLRSRRAADSADYRVVVLNLLNGAERTLFRASNDELIHHIGWSLDGASLYVATNVGVYLLEPPPARASAVAVPPSSRADADSAFRVYVGSPAFAEVRACLWKGTESALCVYPRAGTETLLVTGGHDPVRWGSDSIGYVRQGDLEVRPLGPGSVRRVVLTSVPRHPRMPTYFSGRPGRIAGE